MPKNKNKSRVLRRIAEKVLQELADGEVLPAERYDLATSLVRQWITYDNHATLFIGEQQIYLSLERKTAGYRLAQETHLPAWIKWLTQDWNILPEEFSDICGQLNRGQSVEVVNREGLPLRLWVNPKERSKGVEELVERPTPTVLKRDHHKIAMRELEQLFGSGLDDDLKEELACAVAKQWQQYEGHAGIFVDLHKQFMLKLTEQDNGNCKVEIGSRQVELGPVLLSLGISEEAINEVISGINLGQEVEFQQKNGTPAVLRHNPKEQRIVVREIASPSPDCPNGTRPARCPKCSAPLRQWESERQQICPICGHLASLS